MEVAVVAWVLCGAISAVSAANSRPVTLSEFFIFLLLGPLGSARTSGTARCWNSSARGAANWQAALETVVARSSDR